jgi:type III pantothenate kinase
MSTLIFLDVGNTRLKWAEVTPRGTIRERSQVATSAVDSRWAAALAKRQAGGRFVAASVVPAVSKILSRALPGITFVHGKLPGLPLAFAYPKPAEIGADRIAAAVGAGTPGPAIVIACGTATAFSVIDRRGRFCGGAIVPGLNAQLLSLARGTAQLPAATLASRPCAVGKSTRGAIGAGVLLGWQGGVVAIVARLRREIGANARVLVTGGEARHLRGVRGLGGAAFRPLLVFEGLRIIADSLPDR